MGTGATLNDRIETLEKLEKLRLNGTLTDAEFEQEKVRLLGASGGSWIKWPLFVVLVALAAAVAMIAWRTMPVKQTTSEPVQVAIKSEPPQPTQKSEFNTPLQAAFYAATKHADSYEDNRNDGPYTVTPLQLLELPFGPVLLTGAEQKDGCHGCAGHIGIYYLEREGNGFRLKGKWPEAVAGWGWGAMPQDWSMTEKFTTFPAIYAEGGYSNQGYSCGGATLTELRPEGPVSSDLIGLSYSDDGAVGEDRTTEYEGKIANIVKGKSFDVSVTGSEQFVERYVWKGNKFAPVTDTKLSC